MKTEQIHSLTETFEGHAQQTESGVEYWLARDLQYLPGYAEWRSFNQSAVSKAKIACEVSGHAVSDHFVGVNKMVQTGSGTERDINHLTSPGIPAPESTRYTHPIQIIPCQIKEFRARVFRDPRRISLRRFIQIPLFCKKMNPIIRQSFWMLFLHTGIAVAQSGNPLALHDRHADSVNNAEFGDFTYLEDGAFITITRCSEDATDAVIIPPFIAGKPVTRIAKKAFSGCIRMTRITIPEGVIAIEDLAFSNCMELTKVILPLSISSIGKLAFSACYKLTELTLPKGLKSIGSWAFASCKNLARVTIPSSVESIGREAFKGCWSLLSFTVEPANPNYSSVDGMLLNKARTTLIACPAGKVGECEIPKGVTSIEAFAFYQCNRLVTVVIPPSTTDIGESAFVSSRSIVRIEIPEGVKNIGSYAFADCRSLASVVIPSSVSTIPERAFQGCSGMKKVTISQGVTSIESSSFSYSSSLTSILIPASVEKIQGSAFANCKNLTAINVEADNRIYSSKAGMLFNKTKTQLIKCPAGIGNEIVIPATVVNIGISAFADCKRLKAIAIPEGVKSIDELAFISCGNLSTVTISSTVKSIGRSAFNNCNSLRSAVFLGDAPTMGEGVFSYAAETFKIIYNDGAAGFTSPLWMGYPSVPVAAPIR